MRLRQQEPGVLMETYWMGPSSGTSHWLMSSDFCNDGGCLQVPPGQRGQESAQHIDWMRLCIPLYVCLFFFNWGATHMKNA
jgi:hypothetical protein